MSEKIMPKVSVIIPIHNSEKYLKQALDSVVNQTLDDIEIICIDNCSTDNSLNIIKEYASKDNRIVIIKQEKNQGQGVARNKGIDIAQGEYIMLLDSDDWLEISACEDAYNQIKRNSNEIVFFNYQIFYEYKNEYKTSDYLDSIKDYINEPNIKLYDVDTTFIGSYHVASIYKKDFLNKYNIRYTNTVQSEDAPFRLKAIFYSDTVSILDKILYTYRIPDNKPKKRDYDNIDHFFYNIEESYRELLKCPKKDKYIKRFMINYISKLLKRYERYDGYMPNIIVKNHLFSQIHKLLRLFAENYDIKNIENYIDMEKYLKFYLYSDLYLYLNHNCLKEICKNIFSITDSCNGKHKIITLFGIKVSIKEKKKEREKYENAINYATKFKPIDHFYSPVPTEEDSLLYLKNKETDIPSTINLNYDEQMALLEEFKKIYDENCFAETKEDLNKREGNSRFCHDNIMFKYADAFGLSLFLRYFKPKRVVEIGCGHSSAVALDTKDIFLKDENIEFTYIEPFPKRLLKLVKPEDNIRLIQQKLQDVDYKIISDKLNAGDLLFIDSTHVLKYNSDVMYIFNKILPNLKKGVYVHFHDIEFPFEYPDVWINQGRFWNEAFLLKQFLSYNNDWKIQLWINAIYAKNPDFIKENFPAFVKDIGGSIYLKKLCD